MRAIVLVDNIKDRNLAAEWGLSICIANKGRRILLDTGGSGLFAENARKLHVSLENVDYAVLSHAHYDHANGMKKFFTINSKAPFYLQKGCEENCYAKRWIFRKYIGLPKGILEQFKDRIVYTSGKHELCEGVWLLSHSTAGLDKIGKREGMQLKMNGGWQYDDFRHEQSLVIDTEKGLVVFNSCSHGGAANIINEAAEAFPDKKVYAMIGGFHLFNKTDEEIHEFADRLKETGVELIYTGHCTGQRAFNLLKSDLGEKIQQLRGGLIIEVN